ncbi:MAG TPA: cysteine-rich CWC family protein [Paucimonas sp.]|nr:cysteine-rich CWC family protein [Paucimonas sp.]
MSVCPRCGAGFSCGMVDGKSDAPCWCTQFPPLPLPEPGAPHATCYCPACLESLTASVPITPAASRQPD